MDYLDFSKELVREVGLFIKDNFYKTNEFFSKGDRNLYTPVDLEAERMIVERIEEEFPGHGILSEERPPKKGNDYLWVIDPLDGTHNFIRGIDIFGVSVGLCFKEEVILGAIYIPSADQLYWAKKGEGSYLNNDSIKVSSISHLKEASICFDSSIRYRPSEMSRALEKISREVFNIRMMGSSVRQLTFLAQGTIDAVIEFNDLPWDCAAGKIIIEEAGGKFTDLNGSQWNIHKKGYVATNGILHNNFINVLNAQS